MGKPYTLDELLIIRAAREIRDDERVVLGVGLPTTAGALAKALHAPHCILMMESGLIDFQPLVPPRHIADFNSCRGFFYSTDLFSTFTTTYRGFVDVCFLGVAQVDKFGNINTTVIGEYENPRLRLPGAGGAPDFSSYSRRTVLTMRGGEFAEKLDYVTSPGYLDGGDSRERSGLFPPGSGPCTLLTTQGVFKFDPVTRELVLSEIHPGVALEAIRIKVPWELKVSPALAQTSPPEDREIDFIRNFAPGEAIGHALSLELMTTYFLKKEKERSA